MQSAIRQIGLIFSTEAGLTRSVSAVGAQSSEWWRLPPSALAIQQHHLLHHLRAPRFPTGSDRPLRPRACDHTRLSPQAALLCLLSALVSFRAPPS